MCNACGFEPHMLDEYHARYLAMALARDTDGEIIDPRYRSDREVPS